MARISYDDQTATAYKAVSLADFLDQVDVFRRSDTVMRSLTDEEYQRGKEQLRLAVDRAEPTARTEPRTSWLDLLVLR